MKSLNFKYIIDAIVRKHKKQYAIVLAVVFVVSAVYIFSLPRYYKTQVQILPELSSESGISLPGNLSSLASLAGISTNLGGEDAINPDIYPDIFNSTTFILSLFDIQVKPDPHTTVSYYDYLTKGQKEPWWGKLFAFAKEDKKDTVTVINPNYLTKEQTAIVKAVKGNLKCAINKRTGMITLTTQAQDAAVSAQLADSIMAELQAYIIRYRTTKARGDLNYVTKLCEEAKAEYLAAQKAYAEYADANQELVLNTYRITSERLENEMQLAYNTYSQFAQQKQLAQAKLQERMPAFTVIQDSVIPIRPAGPKRTMFVFFALFFTTVVLTCYFAYAEIKLYFQQQE